MDKTELIIELAKSLNTTKKNAEEAVNAVLAIIAEHLADGDGISISGFGALTVRLTPERTARNPRTMERVIIPERGRVIFKASPKLLEKINKNCFEEEKCL